jgi:flagellin
LESASTSSAGATFTQTSTVTVNGGLGTQTFTAAAGSTLQQFFAQVNASSIGVTAGIDNSTGKVLFYNNNYGVTGTDANGNTNSTGVNAVSVGGVSGDFSLTGLALNLNNGVANVGHVNESANFTGGAGQGAVNAVVTVFDPTVKNIGYRNIVAQGQNSDLLQGTGGLTGINMTLANPGNIIGTDAVNVSDNKALNLQASPNQHESIALSIDSVTSMSLGVNGLDLSTVTGAQNAITTLSNAINTLSVQRTHIGVFTNQLTSALQNASLSEQNLQSARSNIQDANIATETIQFTRDQILLQAGTSVLAQANQAPTGLLALLR